MRKDREKNGENRFIDERSILRCTGSFQVESGKWYIDFFSFFFFLFDKVSWKQTYLCNSTSIEIEHETDKAKFTWKFIDDSENGRYYKANELNHMVHIHINMRNIQRVKNAWFSWHTWKKELEWPIFLWHTNELNWKLCGQLVVVNRYSKCVTS